VDDEAAAAEQAASPIKAAERAGQIILGANESLI
jgi:hypothetical protein